MNFDHNAVVAFAKSFGLFYMMAMSAVVLLYVYWPSRRKSYDDASKTILHDEDRPWR